MQGADAGQSEQLSTSEAADVLGKSVRSTIRLVEAGVLVPTKKLPGIRGAYLFDRADIERLAKERVA